MNHDDILAGVGSPDSLVQILCEGTRIATLFLDRERRVKGFTPAVRDLFQLTRRDTGRPIEDVGERLAYDGMAADVEQVLGSLESIERKVRTAEGRRFLVRVLPNRTAGGVVDGAAVTFVEITELEEAQEEIERLNTLLGRRLEELERVEEQLRRSERDLASRVAEERLRRAQRLASLGTLAAGIAHELNNPVNSILMTADSALVTGGFEDGRERLEEDLRIIVREAERAGRIIGDVLGFAHENRAEKSSSDLNEVVERAVRLMTKDAGQARAEIHLDLEQDLPPVELNRGEIEQVLVNLIQNACAASEGTVRIDVTTRRGDATVVLTVRDDGAGMTREVRERIFDPFFTTRREAGGAGLGLSLTHTLVVEHGGTIDVESAPGEGSAFHVELPVREA